MEQAACRDYPGEWWFPFNLLSLEARKAQHICRTLCPVRAECHSLATSNRETFGIWGGEMFGKADRVVRGSENEQEMKDALSQAIRSGWTISEAARHLRIPYQAALRFAREEQVEQQKEVKQEENLARKGADTFITNIRKALRGKR